VSLLLLLLYCSADRAQAQQDSQILPELSASSRKRKRRKEEQEGGHLSPRIRDQSPSKRPQTSPPSCTAEVELKEKKERPSGINEKDVNPLECWTRTQRWPEEYFEQDSQVREDLEQDSWLEEQMENSTEIVKYVETNGLRLLCPIRKAPNSVRRKQSDSSLNGSSNQKSRESKSAKYRNASYTILLERKGTYMDKSDLDITKGSKDLCQRLLELEQALPKDLLFRDDLFEKTCRKTKDRNKARVIQDIA